MSKRSQLRREKKFEERQELEQAFKQRRYEEMAGVRRIWKWIGLGAAAVAVLALLVWGGIELWQKMPWAAIPLPSGDKLTNAELVENKFVTMHTTLGDMKFELDTTHTPITAGNFVALAQNGYYDGVKFHRVVEDFMIQSGDPNSTNDDPEDDGFGGPGYQFDDEYLKGEYTRGTLAMANSGEDTNGSQFFVMHVDASEDELPKSYVVFGHLIEGFDVLDAIATTPVEENEAGEVSRPKQDIVIESIELSKE